MTCCTRTMWTSLVLSAAAIVATGSTGRADDKNQKKAQAQIQAARKAALKKALQQAQQAKKLADKKPAQAAADKKPAGSPNRPATPALTSKKPFRLPAKLDAPALAKAIDAGIERQYAANDVKPSPRADDADFLRRVYLDLTGVIPSADKAVEFLDSTDPNKRTALVDKLLAGSAYAKHQTDIWQALLIPRTSDNRRLQSEPFSKWLEQSFAANKPWDKFVGELLTASGPQDENGATTFFIANNSPDKMTDQVCRLFLGVQLQCAQCHNHPFTEIKQDEYWGMAAFFMKVRMNGNPQQAARQGKTLEVSEISNERQARRAPGLPESAKIVPAKFLQGEQPKLTAAEPNRPVLAKWLTVPENPYFAKAMVNRTWAQLFGRGFVTPVDDMHDAHPPSHPELLNDLAGQFAANGFDLKHLIRAICRSETYQRSSKPFAGNDADDVFFSHMAIKPLSPEQLYDSLTLVVGERGRDVRARPNQNQQGPPPITPRMQFVNFFTVDESADPVEYQAGVPQALRLMNAPQFNPVNAAIVTELVRSRTPQDQIVQQLCLTALSRRPTPEETVKWTSFLASERDARKAACDLLWVMLNSSEFALNR